MLLSLLAIAVTLSTGCNNEPLSSHATGGAAERTESIVCASCHLHDYQATSMPKHSGQGGAGYDTNCGGCHTKTSWFGAVDHSFWPLTGKHKGAPCAKCHDNQPKPPTECSGCHINEYAATTNPPHKDTGYPTTCKDCHTTSAWQPAAALQHNQFPINNGDHNGVACATCHIEPSNFKNFSCMTGGCHPKGDMDNEHLGDVNGYAYEAKKCYSCHPNGQAD